MSTNVKRHKIQVYTRQNINTNAQYKYAHYKVFINVQHKYALQNYATETHRLQATYYWNSRSNLSIPNVFLTKYQCNTAIHKATPQIKSHHQPNSAISVKQQPHKSILPILKFNRTPGKKKRKKSLGLPTPRYYTTHSPLERPVHERAWRPSHPLLQLGLATLSEEKSSATYPRTSRAPSLAPRIYILIRGESRLDDDREWAFWIPKERRRRARRLGETFSPACPPLFSFPFFVRARAAGNAAFFLLAFVWG